MTGKWTPVYVRTRLVLPFQALFFAVWLATLRHVETGFSKSLEDSLHLTLPFKHLEGEYLDEINQSLMSETVVHTHAKTLRP